jgi:hypothetical protein
VAGNAFLKVGANNAINAGNLRQAVIEDNVILSGPTTGGSGIWLIGMTYLDQVGVHDLVVEDNYVLGLRGNAWFRIDGFPRYGLAGWTAFSGEAGATEASFVDPAAAPDIESYQASIGHEPTMGAFLDKARRQWQRHWGEEYTAAAVISYLRAELGLAPLSSQ